MYTIYYRKRKRPLEVLSLITKHSSIEHIRKQYMSIIDGVHKSKKSRYFIKYDLRADQQVDGVMRPRCPTTSTKRVERQLEK